MNNNYFDTDSDSTVEETLVMLNMPQLNSDESKLKNLNIFRNKKAEIINLECDNEMKTAHEKKIERFEKTFNPKKLLKSVVSNEINSKEINLTKNNENGEIVNIKNSNEFDNTKELKQCNNKDEVKNKTNDNIINNDSYIIEESDNDILNETKQDKKSENCLSAKKNKNHLNDNIDNIPFEIKNITLKNLFTECPRCVINDKYKFKGIQTSSIGTNLYFKEPENLKNQNDLKSCERSYEDYNRIIKNENKMSRDDFSIYEGHSTKIISFEIEF